jgi:hypothetical protein
MIMSMLNLSDITSKFRDVGMFEFADLQVIFLT